MFHDGLPAYGAKFPFKAAFVGCFDACGSKARTARVAASAAVCLRQNVADLSDAGIFVYSKLV